MPGPIKLHNPFRHKPPPPPEPVSKEENRSPVKGEELGWIKLCNLCKTRFACLHPDFPTQSTSYSNDEDCGRIEFTVRKTRESTPQNITVEGQGVFRILVDGDKVHVQRIRDHNCEEDELEGCVFERVDTNSNEHAAYDSEGQPHINAYNGGMHSWKVGSKRGDPQLVFTNCNLPLLPNHEILHLLKVSFPTFDSSPMVLGRGKHYFRLMDGKVWVHTEPMPKKV